MSGKTPPPAVVYDCMVFLQWLVRERGPAVACLDLFETGRVRLCISLPILEEIREVLLRPTLRRKFPSLTTERVDRLLEGLLQRAEVITEVPEVFNYPRDPKDEPYLDLAIAAEADFLVSRDNDLLDLARGIDPAGQELRKLHPRLILVDPAGFLKVMEEK